MTQNAPQSVKVSTGDVRVKGHGSSAVAHHHAHAISQGVEQAVRNITGTTNLQGNLHLDQLKIRIPAGANKQQISDSVQRALIRAFDITKRTP